MHKRITLWAGIVCAGVLALAGCTSGNDPGESSSDPGESSSDPGESSSSDPGESGGSDPGESSEGSGSPPIELRLVRLFSDCSQEYQGVTDPDEAVGECGIITTLTNQWNAENPDVQIVTQVADSTNYYQQLSTQLGSGEGADIVLMHGLEIPRFAARDVLTPMSDRLAEAGVDLADLTPTAVQNVTVDGEVYGLPFDVHTILAHINVDMFREAGMVDAEGQPVLPTSPEELLAAAETVQRVTGKDFLAVQSDADIGTSWLLASLVWQQGGEIIDEAGPTATIDTPEMREAVELMKSLADGGFYDPNISDTNASFLNGEVAIILNGTWAVNQFDDAVANGDAAFTDYAVFPMPTLYDTPSAWSNSHNWVVPVSDDDPAVEAAKDRFLAFLYENNFAWARTGHLPVRTSVIDSADYNELPQRESYAAASTIARTYPQVEQIEAFNAVLREQALAAYLGEVAVDEALGAAQTQATRALQSGQ